MQNRMANGYGMMNGSGTATILGVLLAIFLILAIVRMVKQK